MEDYMKSVYYDEGHPASFSGIRKLYQAVKQKFPNVKLSQVERFLKAQKNYTLHKNRRVKFKRMKTKVLGVNQLFQADLLDMKNLSGSNNRVRYLLTVIDVFSKLAYAYPVTKKSKKNMVLAFKKLLRDLKGNYPAALQTDAGKEFTNDLVQDLLKEAKIHFYLATDPQTKASVVERFNRTLRSRIRKYLAANKTKKYLGALPSIISAYNQTQHSAHDMKPSDVTPFDNDKIMEKLYPPSQKDLDFKYPINTPVRVSFYVSTITKNKQTAQSWSDDIFYVAKHLKRQVPVYKLRDEDGHLVHGSYYEEEISPVRLPQE